MMLKTAVDKGLSIAVFQFINLKNVLVVVEKICYSVCIY